MELAFVASKPRDSRLCMLSPQPPFPKKQSASLRRPVSPVALVTLLRHSLCNMDSKFRHHHSPGTERHKVTPRIENTPVWQKRANTEHKQYQRRLQLLYPARMPCHWRPIPKSDLLGFGLSMLDAAIPRLVVQCKLTFRIPENLHDASSGSQPEDQLSCARF